MATVTRTYQLGGTSHFTANDRSDLIATIQRDQAAQRETGDEQGIKYIVPDFATAMRLGCYETAGGEWVIEGTEQTVEIEA